MEIRCHCGRPSIGRAVDSEETTQSGDKWESWRPMGEVRHGCAKHLPAVRHYYLDGHVEETIYRQIGGESGVIRAVGTFLVGRDEPRARVR